MTCRLRLDLAYDGSSFSGWARQPGLITVQGVVEDAICRAWRLTPDQLAIVVAGRTDAGVHASGQVCHLDIDSEAWEKLEPRGVDHLLRRARGALGRTGAVVLHSLSRAPEGFDARFSPLGRRYQYRIADAAARHDPRTRHFTVWLDELLDVAAMNTLGHDLLGLRDFASFCRARPGATTIRTLEQFSWERGADGVLVATVQADAFCHSMVRSLVGAAVAVGRGQRTRDDILAVVASKKRESLWKTMPAHGLTLESVLYPVPDQLAARADATRALRTAPSD